MKKQKFLSSCFVFLLIFTFSMLVFGCGGKDESKIQTKKIEGKQLMEKNSTHASEAEVIRVDSSGPDMAMFLSPVWHKELARALYLVF
jgi:hypothetical protein